MSDQSQLLIENGARFIKGLIQKLKNDAHIQSHCVPGPEKLMSKKLK